jgi:Cdc6-like AAA superfamily ATPase
VSLGDSLFGKEAQSRPVVTNTRHNGGESDKSYFEAKVRSCLDDPRIARYFQRGLASHDVITQELVDGEAFSQALKLESYRRYAVTTGLTGDAAQRNRAIAASGPLTPAVLTAFTSPFVILALLCAEGAVSGGWDMAIMAGWLILAILAAALYVRARIRNMHRRRTTTIALASLLISAVGMLSPRLLHFPWSPYLVVPAWSVVVVLGVILGDPERNQRCRDALTFVSNVIAIEIGIRDGKRLRGRWLEDCVEDVIMPQAVLAINTVLGEDKDRLLVEQNSEGLRRLQDPSFTVPTQSEERLANVLSQMDGGSIALAGPRGAGKSTLLRKFSGPKSIDLRNYPCISVYLTAPAQYIPRDFIAQLLQRLCEEYLDFVQLSLPEPIRERRPRRHLRYVVKRVGRISWLCLRTLLALSLVGFLLYLLKPDYSHLYSSVTADYLRARTLVSKDASLGWKLHRGWCIFFLALLAFLLLPLAPQGWRTRSERPAPALAKRAQEYLIRLQVDKTVSWGISVAPTVRGMGWSVTKGESASYAPWTLPELVAHTRSFMEEIGETFRRSPQAVVVGIDEIDRIGSVAHAESFLGEIKAVFGVEKSFFLVAVAEDVGSVFAQRAMEGRSILENAFDDVIAVGPLSLAETRDLLLKRVPGYTDSPSSWCGQRLLSPFVQRGIRCLD